MNDGNPDYDTLPCRKCGRDVSKWDWYGGWCAECCEPFERQSRSPLPQFVEAGWRFAYCEETRWITGEHPLGGKIIFAKMSHMIRSGGDPVNWHEVGHAIAALLNGNQPQRKDGDE